MDGALIVFSVLVFVAFLVWNRTKDKLERRRLQLEVQEKMLDRIGPGEALTEFLRTDEGKWFVGQLTAEPSQSKDARTRILALTTLGLIALFGGLFFVNAALIPNVLVDEPEIPTDLVALFALPAFLLTGAGIGALVAAWIMRRLSKRWGMTEARGADIGGEQDRMPGGL
jgi:hypothetical protein